MDFNEEHYYDNSMTGVTNAIRSELIGNLVYFEYDYGYDRDQLEAAVENNLPPEAELISINTDDTEDNPYILLYRNHKIAASAIYVLGAKPVTNIPDFITAMRVNNLIVPYVKTNCDYDRLPDILQDLITEAEYHNITSRKITLNVAPFDKYNNEIKSAWNQILSRTEEIEEVIRVKSNTLELPNTPIGIMEYQTFDCIVVRDDGRYVCYVVASNTSRHNLHQEFDNNPRVTFYDMYD